MISILWLLPLHKQSVKIVYQSAMIDLITTWNESDKSWKHLSICEFPGRKVYGMYTGDWRCMNINFKETITLYCDVRPHVQRRCLHAPDTHPPFKQGKSNSPFTDIWQKRPLVFPEQMQVKFFKSFDGTQFPRCKQGFSSQGSTRY